MRKPLFKFFLLIFTSGFLLTGYQQELPRKDSKPNSILEKITFDITAISPEGLIGPPNGLRSVSYEFCIPAREQSLKEVQAIDPTIKYYANSPGRIGCHNDQYLCIGDTHNPQWKAILLSIAGLNYVERIDQFHGE